MKPPYRISNMAEIEAMPTNGLKVASMFSGVGGSSLGYRMAGYRVLWASEFVSEAAAIYRANCPATIVDQRDIRMVQSDEILQATGLKTGELDILDGSPPCASFSTAGKREKYWNQIRPYAGLKQRVDDLFDEYIRIVRGIRPRVFIAENVAGLTRGVARGYFNRIRRDLITLGYRVGARQLDAQWLGIPQTRLRLFFIGVREDLARDPVFPLPFPYRYMVSEVLPHIKHIERAVGFKNGIRFRVSKGRTLYHSTVPIATILASQPLLVEAVNESSSLLECRKMTIAEAKLLSSFPEDFALGGTYAKQWEFLGRAVPPLMMRAVAATIRSVLQ